jgi:RNA polymerase sigma-70 factor (ECF subfamily)
LAKENQFINALKNPDTQEFAFNKLISDYKERLYWHVRKIVIDHDDANDVLQNTFIKIFNNINTFKENSSIYTWMYRIATNESLNYINKKAKKKQEYLMKNG